MAPDAALHRRHSTPAVLGRLFEASAIASARGATLRYTRSGGHMHRDRVTSILRQHADELRRRFGVVSLRLFGSVVRDEASAASDVDLLVDFGGPAGYAQYMDLLLFLEDLLAKRVDLVTERGLRAELRPHVEREAVRVA
jgi:predicted nucleotidyltransferase